jgi:hypothetical protein
MSLLYTFGSSSHQAKVLIIALILCFSNTFRIKAVFSLEKALVMLQKVMNNILSCFHKKSLSSALGFQFNCLSRSGNHTTSTFSGQ